MLLITGKEILQGINLKLDETLKELSQNYSDEIEEKNILLGSYEERNLYQKKKIEFLEKELKELSEQQKVIIAKSGGLTKGNNKLQKDKAILQEKIKSLTQKIKNQENTIATLTKKVVEKEKLQAIIIQQEKIIERKFKGKPTKEEIINYDKKSPLMK